jgi:DNA polymerase elongation subunit (family B)
MYFYTNAHAVGNNVLVRGYDNGKQFFKKILYSPTLYIPTKDLESQYKTLDNAPVEPKKFQTIRDAKQFVQRYQGVNNFDIYGNFRFTHTYLNEEFPGKVVFDKSLIRVANIDIEVKSDDGFPSPTDAFAPITAITLEYNNVFYAISCGDYTPKDKNVKYLKCKDEKDLILKFLKLWNKIKPDVVTGWNITFFDIPYLINRTTNILGKRVAKTFSPWGLFTDRTTTIMGKTQQLFDIVGIAVLDMLEIYKKFTQEKRESYKLNYIAHVELNERKIDYSEYRTLYDLYEKNFEKYIDYNIHDTRLVQRIDQKGGFIDLVLTAAYDAKVNYSDVFTQIRLWDTIIHNYLLDRKIVVPQKKKTPKNHPYEGAYVKDPQVGMHEWIVSFDLVSLYPHLHMQYNLSPETIIEDIHIDKHIKVKDVISGKVKNDTEYALAANGYYFDKSKQGFLPEIIETMFNDRARAKKKMLQTYKDIESIKKELKKRT